MRPKVSRRSPATGPNFFVCKQSIRDLMGPVLQANPLFQVERLRVEHQLQLSGTSAGVRVLRRHPLLRQRKRRREFEYLIFGNFPLQK
jgi:hypothetical protein